MFNALERLPLFHGLGRARLRQLIQAARFVTYQAGEIVFRAGDPADTMHVVISGEARVVGKPHANTLGPGDSFGEMALLDGGLRSATIAAAGDLQTMVLPRAAFVELLQQEPGIAMAMTAELSWQVRRLEASARPRARTAVEPLGWAIPGLV
jgi:CRP/FNR family cyclic AMP-dependent transcriptional regulator